MIIQGPKRIAFFLPNTFTALNMACGFSAILLALNGKYYLSCMIMLLGAIFDSVDGRVARLTGTQSAFGEQFDSISDVVSFGFAPAIIFYLKFLAGFGRAGAIIAFTYLLCGALRLARFNANIEKISSDFFQGLPIPGAAIGMLGFVLFTTEYNLGAYTNHIAGGTCVFLAFLMISNIPFASFKNSEFVKKNKKKVLALIFLTFALILINEQVMILAVITLYVISCLIYDFIYREKMSTIFDWADDEEE